MVINAITVEVVRGALTYAAEEMGIALRNAAYSPNIKERMDFSCTIFSREKRLVAQAEHIPVHLGSMATAVQLGLGHFKGELEEGDMILMNDPYLSGTHLPDITLVFPIYYKGEIIAYTANKAHHSDVGGKTPGSMTGDATELFQEGLIIPPVKFLAKGKINQDIARLILSNVRTPDIRMGDLRAQIAANNIGRRRILELIKKFDVQTFFQSTETIMNLSESRIRTEIKKMVDGAYEAEDWLENTGISSNPVKIKVTLIVEGDQLKIDYAGTAPQTEGPINAVRGVTLSGVYYTLRCVTDPTIPMNEGCYRPVEVDIPTASLLNPVSPAPVAGGNVETSQRNVDTLLKAFSKIVPEKICAACQGTMNNITVGGINPKTGRAWTFYETVAGGFGGRAGADGLDAVHSHMTNTMNTPIETIELTYPMRFIKYELREDSGGPGKWRGGVGVERSWMLLAPSAVLSILAERTEIAPWGLKGGKQGAKGEYWLIKRDKKWIKLKSKCTVQMKRGDIFLVKTPGGGGYGDPKERDTELVSRDVSNGLVSRKSVKDNYGIRHF